MHIPLRKVAYIPTKKTWFCVTVTERSELQEMPIEYNYRIDALCQAAAEFEALHRYLSRYDIDKRHYLINTGRVTTSVLTHVDKDGRIVPFYDKRYSGLVRVMILVCALLILVCALMLGCTLFWLLGQAWLTLTAG